MPPTTAPDPSLRTALARRLKLRPAGSRRAALRPVTRPRHVALVTETMAPEVNGVAMTLTRLTDGLLAGGYRVSIVRPDRQDLGASDPRLLTHAVPGLPIPGYGALRFGLPGRGRLRRLWQADPPDLVHVATEGPLGWSAVGAARDLGAAVTSSYHTDFEHYARHYRLGWSSGLVADYLRRFHNRTDLTLVPTLALQHELANRGYQRLAVIGRGIDEGRFRPERRSATLRAQWGLADDDPAILHVGRLAAEKNLDLLFESYRVIRNRCPRARLIVVGDGPRRRALERAHPDVLFTGQRLGDDLAEHYASGDVFLFPSLTDTYGNVVVEALASGLAVVAFNRGAAAEWIEDGQSGALVAPAAPHEFIEAAASLAEHRWLRARLRFCAATRGAGASWSVVASRFAMFLDQAYQRHRRQSIDRAGWAPAVG